MYQTELDNTQGLTATIQAVTRCLHLKIRATKNFKSCKMEKRQVKASMLGTRGMTFDSSWAQDVSRDMIISELIPLVPVQGIHAVCISSIGEV